MAVAIVLICLLINLLHLKQLILNAMDPGTVLFAPTLILHLGAVSPVFPDVKLFAIILKIASSVRSAEDGLI